MRSGALERQRPQQHRVDDAEDRGGGADAERERDDGGEREAGPAEEAAGGEAQVLEERVHGRGEVKAHARAGGRQPAAALRAGRNRQSHPQDCRVAHVRRGVGLASQRGMAATALLTYLNDHVAGSRSALELLDYLIDQSHRGRRARVLHDGARRASPRFRQVLDDVSSDWAVPERVARSRGLVRRPHGPSQAALDSPSNSHLHHLKRSNCWARRPGEAFALARAWRRWRRRCRRCAISICGSSRRAPKLNMGGSKRDGSTTAPVALAA